MSNRECCFGARITISSFVFSWINYGLGRKNIHGGTSPYFDRQHIATVLDDVALMTKVAAKTAGVLAMIRAQRATSGGHQGRSRMFVVLAVAKGY